MNEEQELNKKLAEGARMSLMAADFGFPSSEVMYKSPDFIQSLDACFKWLVPKAIKLLQQKNIWTYRQAEIELFRLWLSELKTDDYALALCRAISKMIEQEEPVRKEIR